MPTHYTNSPYGVTIGISGTKKPLSSDLLRQCALFTQGGTIPFWIRYQYKVFAMITGGTRANPIFGGWGPLDETVDKVNAIPGLRIMLPIQQFPSMYFRIDHYGNDVGYGGVGAVLPRWDDFGAISKIIAQRYGDRIHCYQISNEEYDLTKSGANSGGVLAPVFNAAYANIRPYSSSPIILGSVRKLPPGGQHIIDWVKAYVNYVPGPGEYPQAIPDGQDCHYYRDGATITRTGEPAPDPATTDNSDDPSNALIPSIADEYGLIQPILDTLSPGIPVMNLEWGWDNSNNAPIQSTYPGTTPPWYVSHYTLLELALHHYSGIAMSHQFTMGQYTDAKSLHKQGLLDLANYIAAHPQYTPGAAPTDYLYCSIGPLGRLDFEGGATGIGQTNPGQFFALGNPTNSNKAWSVTKTQSWLTVVTIPTNGMKNHANEGLTSGTLKPGQFITLKATTDTTGLATLTQLTDTLTVTVGSYTKDITVNVWANPADATPSIKTDQTSGLAPTAVVGGANPASQVIHITNTGNYKHQWYGYTLAGWLDISVASGTLNAGASQAVTLTYDITGLAPGNYMQCAYFCLTPFPPQYKSDAPPVGPQYVNVFVNLKITADTSPNLQLSTDTLYFTSATGASMPASQPFYLLNCSKNAEPWTTSIDSYTGGASGWLSLDKTHSTTNLPGNGSFVGTTPDIQHTDYQLLVASVDPTGLAPGTYTATIHVTLGESATEDILVTYEVTGSQTMTLGISPNSATLSQVQGGTAVTTVATLTNSGNTTGSFSITKTAGATWLSINPNKGTLAGGGGTQDITFTCTPGSLAPRTYNATVTFIPSIGSASTTFTIAFTVTAPPTIAADPLALSLSQTQGGSAVIATSNISNSGASGSWTSAITYTHGTGWLAISPNHGTLNNGQVTTITFTCTPGALTADTYTAYVTFTLGASQVQVNVTFTINPVAPPSVTVNPASLQLSQKAGGVAVTGTATLTNSGSTGTYTSAITYTHGSGWLTISPTSTSITGSGGTQDVTFTCDPAGLTHDTYTGYVIFTLGATQAQVNVTFTVNALAPPSIKANPLILTFVDTVGNAENPPAQIITLTNGGEQPGAWTSTLTYTKESDWVVCAPIKDTLAAGTSEQVTVSVNDNVMKAGTYKATITFTMGATSVQVLVILVLNAQVIASDAQMTQSDLKTQYERIMTDVVGSVLDVLAYVYYGVSPNTQTVYGELDALFPFETMGSVHPMKSINDVTAFLNAFAYVASVLADTPLVFYPLGESKNIYANDISGRKMTGQYSHNPDGTLAGVTLGQAGALAANSDTAVLFDGSTGYVQLPASVNTTYWGAFTVEAWVKLTNTSFTQTACILASDAPATTHLGIQIAVTKNSIVFRVGTGTSYYELIQSYSFVAGVWYHLAYVFTGTELQIDVRGVQVASKSVASTLVGQTLNSMQIGALPGATTNNVPGTLQYVALYPIALSAAQVLAHYRQSLIGALSYFDTIMARTTLIAYWRMNETSGTTAYDSTHNHYDASLAGVSLSYSQTGILANDSAIGFGDYDSFTFPRALNPSTFTSWSLEYWIYITGWSHIVITIDTDGTTLYYLNGALYPGSGSGDQVVVDQEVAFTGSYSAGSLDEIAVYSGVLTPEEISTDYTKGLAGI